MSNFMTNIMTLAVHLEQRGDIWDKDGRKIFSLSGTDGQLVPGKAWIFLKDPAPTCNEDAIEIVTDPLNLEDIDRLIEARKASLKKPQAFAVEFKPTIWHRLGFGECSAPILEDEDYPTMAPGAITTEVRVYFDWKDRLRILLSGCVMTAARTKTKEPVLGEVVVSITNVSVMRPGSLRQVKP